MSIMRGCYKCGGGCYCGFTLSHVEGAPYCAMIACLVFLGRPHTSGLTLNKEAGFNIKKLDVQHIRQKKKKGMAHKDF